MVFAFFSSNRHSRYRLFEMETRLLTYMRCREAGKWAPILGLAVVLCYLAIYQARAPLPEDPVPPTVSHADPPARIEAAPNNPEAEQRPLPAAHPDTSESDIRGIILQVAGRHDVDAALIMAMVHAESRYDPKAVSGKGAMGLMQLMPGTAEDLGVKDGFNPEENVDGGVRYFKQLLQRVGGNVTLALAAYNAGLRHVRDYSGVPPFKATRHYIEKVLKYYREYKAQLAGADLRTPSADGKRQAALS
jgi:soluble lytic murein transglycosylase-like protein